MKAFVVNLDRRPDRMELFLKNEFPFDVERVSAIEHPNGGEGCRLSHFKIMEQQKEFPFVIFEDDCQFVEPWSLVETAIAQLPSDWDALWLGGTLDGPLNRYSQNLFTLTRAYCTHAIVYNSQAMVDYILNAYKTGEEKRVIDVFYHSDVQFKFKCFITYPLTTIQHGGRSDVMYREQDELDQKWRRDCYNKYTNEIRRKRI
jgi:GR25 family glycosyltransferase involved in LPS biosynthesis